MLYGIRPNGYEDIFVQEACGKLGLTINEKMGKSKGAVMIEDYIVKIYHTFAAGGSNSGSRLSWLNWAAPIWICQCWPYQIHFAEVPRNWRLKWGKRGKRLRITRNVQFNGIHSGFHKSLFSHNNLLLIELQNQSNVFPMPNKRSPFKLCSGGYKLRAIRLFLWGSMPAEKILAYYYNLRSNMLRKYLQSMFTSFLKSMTSRGLAFEGYFHKFCRLFFTHTKCKDLSLCK